MMAEAGNRHRCAGCGAVHGPGCEVYVHGDGAEALCQSCYLAQPVPPRADLPDFAIENVKIFVNERRPDLAWVKAFVSARFHTGQAECIINDIEIHESHGRLVVLMPRVPGQRRGFRRQAFYFVTREHRLALEQTILRAYLEGQSSNSTSP